VREEPRRRFSRPRIVLWLLGDHSQALHFKLEKEDPAGIALMQPVSNRVTAHKEAASLRPPDQEFVRDLIKQRKPPANVDPFLHRWIAPTGHGPNHSRAFDRKRGMEVALVISFAFQAPTYRMHSKTSY
jgi:hypothetical protein